jgi:hypothetical protein
MPQRVNGGQLLVIVGAIALLVSLALDWYEPGFDAWSVFEIVDLLLAAIAVAAIVGVVSVALPGLGLPLPPPSAPLVLGLAAFVIVAAALINQPPLVAERDPDTGAWVALAGAGLMALGALLSVARVSFEITVAPRERRAQRAEAFATEEPAYEDEPAYVEPEPPDEGYAVEPTEPTPTESLPTEEHPMLPEDDEGRRR